MKSFQARIIIGIIGIVIALLVNISIVAFIYGKGAEKIDNNSIQITYVEQRLNDKIDKMEMRLVGRLDRIEDRLDSKIQANMGTGK